MDITSNSTASDCDYEQIVEQRFNDELVSFKGSLGRSHIYESHTNATGHISGSYKGRTLIELIQNGYDPHSANRTDGEISVLLDLVETEFGCLYVANRGLGFTQENFDGICDMARSPKIVNQGIGNKGLGFRGVLQVCQNPEIYSQNGKGIVADDFYGFRFTFPTDVLLTEKIRESEYAPIKNEILETVPRALLPVYLNSSPAKVREFAAKGFATVIRMPLGRADAANELKTQIDQICDHDIPIHIFLERLASINIVIIDDDGEDERECFSQTLKRDVKRQWSTSEMAFQLVGIDDNSSYIVVKKTLPELGFRPRLEDGIVKNQLPDSWRNWQGDAQISLAVETTGNNEIGRLYNFLPMESSAESPFSGHVNAPFLCDIDRTKLVENVDLNDYFLEEVAGLCLETVAALKEDSSDLARAIAIDLTMWDGGNWEKINVAALKTFNTTIDKAPIIPTCRGSVQYPWACIYDLTSWPGFSKELPVLSQQFLARTAQLSFPDENIDSDGILRLEDLAWQLCEIDLSPDLTRAASWVAIAAKKLLSEGTSISIWDQFYQDLSEVFSEGAEALQGAPILLTENSRLAELLSSEKSEEDVSPKDRRRKNHAVFLPSTRQTSISETGEELEDDEEDNLFHLIPKSLNNSIQLVHSELKLTSRNDPTKARAFLIENKLVNSFRREDLQRVLGNLTAFPGSGEHSEVRRFDALQLSFELSEGGTRTAELADMPFHVPTRNGEWVPAGSAYFGKEWKKTHGEEFEQLITLGGSYSSEFAALEDDLILGGTWPANGQSHEWIKYLRRLGVVDTLRVLNVRPRGAFKNEGHQLRGNLLHRCVESELLRDCWEQDLPNTIKNPYTKYTVRRIVPMISGLNDYWSFPNKLRRQFAIELLRTLIERGDSILEISIYRPDRYGQDNQTTWVSPIASFLRHEKWLPASSSVLGEHFCRPDEVWHAPKHGSFVRPGFLTTLIGECRDIIDSSLLVQDLLQKKCGLKILGSSHSAKEQVSELGFLAYSNKIQRNDIALFDKLYAEGWNQVVSDVEGLAEIIRGGEFYLAAHVSDDVHGYKLNNEEQMCDDSESKTPIYVADDVSPAKRDLLKEMGKPIFDFKFESRGLVADFLCGLSSEVSKVSDVTLSIYVDGELFDSSDSHEYLITPQLRWLQDAIVVICDLSSAFMTIGSEGLDKLRIRLARIRYSIVERIEIEIDKERRQLPGFLQNSLLINDETGPLLLIESDGKSLTWNILRQASHSIAEALGWPNQLEAVLSSAFAQLIAIQGSQELSELDEGDYQAICRKGKQTVREALRGLRHVTEVLIETLRPVLLVSTDEATYQQISQSFVDLNNESEIAGLLKLHQGTIEIDVDKILDACKRNDSLAGVRRELNIDLAMFNMALEKLGTSYITLDFGEDQRIAFNSFVKTQEAEILSCLRHEFLPNFESIEPLDEYVLARKFDSLKAENEWATKFEEVPEPLFIDCINTWLNAQGALGLHESKLLGELEVNSCREENRKQLNKFVQESWPILAAWCNKTKTELPAVWHVQNEAPQHITQLAGDQGWLDFRILNRAEIIERLNVYGAWPSSMPASLDLTALNIAPEELDTSKQEETSRQLERQRKANTIVVGEHELSMAQPNFIEALDTISSLYDDNEALWNGSARVTRMSPLVKTGNGNAVKSGKGNVRSGFSNQMPQGQKDAIGLLGEKLAFKWLKTHYPELVDEKSWVSGNREKALQSEPGRDWLGYDFEVNHSSYVGYYEVKATSGDEPFFRMGPTEVEQAVKCRKDSKYHYRVIFIRNVINPEHTTIQLLPNPFSDKDKAKFHIVTKGEVGLKFDLN